MLTVMKTIVETLVIELKSQRMQQLSLNAESLKIFIGCFEVNES